MAMYLMVAVIHCGPPESAAKAVEDHFVPLRLRTTDGHETHCVVWKNQNPDGTWWVSVWPHGCAWASPLGVRDEIATAEAARDFQRALLDHLKTCPAFAVAIVDGEAWTLIEQWNTVTAEELCNWNGTVLSRQHAERFGNLPCVQPFQGDYTWVPTKATTRQETRRAT